MAKGIGKILGSFFSRLKKNSHYIRFVFVTGITRYALSMMGSGTRHLRDVSLNPKYAGICGFTLKEFPSLFESHMIESLTILKNNGLMKQSDTVFDLMGKIYDWYDGYDWGGCSRVLNPLSILHFFKNNEFDFYWIQSECVMHLREMLHKRPLDFLCPRLESHPVEEFWKSDLQKLSGEGVLFQGGYLTIDKKPRSIMEKQPGEKGNVDKLYSLRIPNYEVSYFYRIDCLNVVLGLDSNKDIWDKLSELEYAVISRNASMVESFFSDFISIISERQRIQN
jgi:hypothetical protein